MNLAGILHAEEAPPTIAALPRSGRSVEVLTLGRRECRWVGPTPASFASVPNKVALDFERCAAWAEIIMIRLLERSHWQAVWVNNWRGEFWRDVLSAVELPPNQGMLFQRIGATTGARSARSGCWDVFAWRGDDVLFIELKQRGHDRLTPTQLTWLESALACGVPLEAFAVVEWSAPKS